jgi:methanethiol S-methyltransferase
MSSGPQAYGLSSLVVINVGVFAILAFSFTRPRTTRDWRTFGAFIGFVGRAVHRPRGTNTIAA